MKNLSYLLLNFSNDFSSINNISMNRKNSFIFKSINDTKNKMAQNKIIELKEVEIKQSPLSKNRSRLIGDIEIDGKIKQYWFDLPSGYHDFMSQSGNIWMLVMLPIAVIKGYSIKIDLPVDPFLRQNLKDLIKIWKSWYKDEIQEIEIYAKLFDFQKNQNRTMSFFSGGVDSWYTLLKNKESILKKPLNNSLEINDIVAVWGFDIPINKPDEFEKLSGSIRNISKLLDINYIDIWTNLRGETLNYLESKSPWLTHWGTITHGIGLAAAAYSLEKLFGKVIIGSTHPYSDLSPWGSHPLTDPLLSSHKMSILHHGAGANRVEKTKFISEYSMVLKTLRVCWKNNSAHNCSNCTKCYRTMITLDLIDKLKDAECFNQDTYTTDRIANIYLNNKNEIDFINEVLELAQTLNRYDVVKQIKKSVRFSSKINLLNKFYKKKRTTGAGGLSARIINKCINLMKKNCID